MINYSIKQPGSTKTTPKRKRFIRKRFISLVMAVSLTSWFYYKHLKATQPPQAILVLGGSQEREKFAAQFAQQYPELKIWISSGSPEFYAKGIFLKAGVPLERLQLDYEAVDTLTNFTTLVNEFKSKGIERLYLITSEDHMLRANVVAEIVLGSHGISIEPIKVPTSRSPESITKVIRDGGRAILWLLTGYTGVSLRR